MSHIKWAAFKLIVRDSVLPGTAVIHRLYSEQLF